MQARTLLMEPEIWTIQLRDGGSLQVLTHGYRVEGEHCLFVLFFEGSPNFEVVSLRIPVNLLEGRVQLI